MRDDVSKGYQRPTADRSGVPVGSPAKTNSGHLAFRDSALAWLGTGGNGIDGTPFASARKPMAVIGVAV
jgi:hypothetical protein